MEISKRTLKIAACQMTVSADIEENFSAIRDGIQQAATKGADIVTFPECALSGYPPIHHLSPDHIDLQQVFARNHDVISLAAEFMVGVVFGTITGYAEKIYNSAVVVDKSGNQAGCYNKMHLFPGDAKFFEPGNELPVFDLDDVKIGVQICYDARFPEPFRYLKKQGTEVAVIISNACGSETWKLPVLEGVYRSRASENSFYVVAVNAAGPLQRAVSRICDVDGISLAAADRDKEQLIITDIDLSRISDGYFSDLRTDIFRSETVFEK